MPDAAGLRSYPLVLSSIPDIRNARLLATAGSLIDRSVSEAIRRLPGDLDRDKGWKGVVVRASKLWFAALPFASLAHVLTHEYGHGARIREFGGTYSVRIDSYPWPVPVSSASTTGFFDGRDEQLLAVVGGGAEAAQVLADEVLSRAWTEGYVSYFDVLLYAYGKTDISVYIFTALRPRALADQARFYSDLELDPRQYAVTWTTLRGLTGFDDVRRTAESMRAGAWWNLVDYPLWAGLVTVVHDYVGQGKEVSPMPGIPLGPARFAPVFKYTPTPRGPERTVGARFATGGVSGATAVRWSDAAHGKRLVGAAGELSFPPSGRGTWRVKGDVWEDPRHGAGGRLEVGNETRLSVLGRHVSLSAGVGGKSSGYLLGFPDTGGFYASGGTVLRF